MGGECSTRVEMKKYVQNFSRWTWREEKFWEIQT